MNIMALHKVHANLKQDGHRVGVFHAFRNCFNIPLVRCSDHAAYTFLNTGIAHQRMHQRAINLDVIRHENIENLKSALLRAEMFQREPYAKIA